MTKPRFLFCVCGEGGVMRRIAQQWKQLPMAGELAYVIADRPCKALEWAKENGLQTKLVAYDSFARRADFDRALQEAIDAFAPDYILLTFNRLLAPAITKKYAYRILNLHYALLPSFPGFGAARQAIQKDVRLAGMTVHLVDDTMDGGPIIAQGVLSVGTSDAVQLGRRMFHLAAPLLLQAARWASENRISVKGAGTVVTNANYQLMPMVPALDADIAAWSDQLKKEGA